MATLFIMALIVTFNLHSATGDRGRKSLTVPDDILGQERDQEDKKAKDVVDDQLADVQFKRKLPSGGHKSNDVGRSLSPSVRPLNTQRYMVTPSGSDDSTSTNQMLSLLLDLSRNMAAMRDVVDDIRFQNHVTYRQLKRILLQQVKSGNDGGTFITSHPETGYQFNKPEMSAKLKPFVKTAALQVDRPQSDQQLQQMGKSQQQQQQLATVNETDSFQQRCPKEFTYSVELNSCYRLAGDRTTWRLARERCRDFKADLASVDSAREQRYLNEKARQSQDTKHCDFWIGLVRGRGSADGGSSWHWIGDHGNGRSPDYTNWNINEPNNANSYEHCTQMLWVFNWRWNDAHCNYGNACYICQAKPLK